jgi:glutamate dehydrogenase
MPSPAICSTHAGLWAAIEALDGKVHGDAQIDAMLQVWHLIRNLTRWLLNLPGGRLDIAGAVSRYGAGFKELRDGLAAVFADTDRQIARQARERWLKAGFDEALADRLSGLPALASGLDVVEVALERKLPLKQVAKVYFNLGEALHLKWLMQKIDELPVEGRWHAHARGVSRDDILWREATRDALALLCASLCFSFASFALNALASPFALVSPLSGKLAID